MDNLYIYSFCIENHVDSLISSYNLIVSSDAMSYEFLKVFRFFDTFNESLFHECFQIP